MASWNINDVSKSYAKGFVKFLKDNNKTAQFTHNPAKERVLIINLKK